MLRARWCFKTLTFPGPAFGAVLAKLYQLALRDKTKQNTQMGIGVFGDFGGANIPPSLVLSCHQDAIEQGNGTRYAQLAFASW